MICLWSEGTNSLIWIWCFCGLDLPFFLATNPSVKISRMSHGLLLQGKVTEKAPVCTGGGSVESISLLMLMLGPCLKGSSQSTVWRCFKGFCAIVGLKRERILKERWSYL